MSDGDLSILFKIHALKKKRHLFLLKNFGKAFIKYFQ